MYLNGFWWHGEAFKCGILYECLSFCLFIIIIIIIIFTLNPDTQFRGWVK